jgi:hypothetical protein
MHLALSHFEQCARGGKDWRFLLREDRRGDVGQMREFALAHRRITGRDLIVHQGGHIANKPFHDTFTFIGDPNQSL